MQEGGRDTAATSVSYLHLVERHFQMYVNLIRPSVQSFPPASPAQHDLPPPSTDRVVKSLPDIPLRPPHLAFTELPGRADQFTLRAMEKHQERIKAATGTLRIDDTSALKASDKAECQIAPQEQDLNAAGILVEVAREQHPISPALDTGSLSVTKSGASDANASLQYTRKCPITSCAYHLDRGFWSTKEKNNHIMTHFEGQIGFITNGSRYSLPWPSYIENPANFFLKIEILKRRLRQHFGWDGYGGYSTCCICIRSVDRWGYVKHVDDCIVHAVLEQALGTGQACPVSTCEHDPPKFPWGSDTDETLVKHFVPSLGCGRCYTNQCQCPPMQQEKGRSSADGFTRLWDELEKI